MRKNILVIVLILSGLLSACKDLYKDLYIVPSIRPFYTDTDTVFDPTLLGTWISPDDSKEVFIFTKEGNNRYKCVYNENGMQSSYIVYLIRIKGHLFMDMFPREIPDKKDILYSSHLLPVHTVFMVRQINPTLIISPLDSSWLVKTIENNPTIVRHEIIKDKFIILTSSPEETQKFLLANVKEAFGISEDKGLIRKKETL